MFKKKIKNPINNTPTLYIITRSPNIHTLDPLTFLGMKCYNRDYLRVSGTTDWDGMRICLKRK